MMMTTAANRERISWSEIAQHNHRSSCWVVIQGKVYNLTNFMDEVSTLGQSRARKPDVFSAYAHARSRPISYAHAHTRKTTCQRARLQFAHV